MTPPVATMIPSVDFEALKKEVLPVVEKVKTMEVKDQETHGEAMKYVKGIAGMKKFVTSVFAGPKAILDKAHKDMVADENKWTVPLEEAKSTITVKILKYEDAERKRAEEEARKLAEEARKAEEQRQLEDAILAEHQGDTAAAEEILNAPVAVPTIAPAPKLSSVGGASRPTYYRCKVVSLIELVKYVAAHPEEIALLQPDETALRKRAESMKDGFKLPGCELEKTQGLSVRSA